MHAIYLHLFTLQKLMSDPHLVVGGESRFDLAQGELGKFSTQAGVGKRDKRVRHRSEAQE